MVKASGPGRRNPMIKIRELVSTVGSLRYEEVDGVRKEKERLTAALHSPPFFPATMLLLKAGKKGGGGKSITDSPATTV